MYYCGMIINCAIVVIMGKVFPRIPTKDKRNKEKQMLIYVKKKANKNLNLIPTNISYQEN